ncbi:zonular occludens toxin domain-containing protein [Halovibrio salipaludis]|nr:zonular occludens toxin domain-containing protein [Halovibrio salipaludis]
MIRLITGVPGAGKTLRAIHYVMEHKERAEKQGLPFRCVGNVDGADPSIMGPMEHEWYEYDEHTLVVFDEAQKTFRPDSPHAKAPKRITELEEHRHKGIDLILVTQHPKLINHHVRRLVGKHEHITRKNNFGLVNVHAMDRAFDVEDRHELHDADVTPWKHPKKLFDLYKSAEVHTEVKGLPRSVKVGGGIVVGGIGLIVLLVNSFASSFAQQGQAAEAAVEASTDTPEANVQEVAKAEPAEQDRGTLAVGGMWTDNRCRLVDENGHVIDTDYNTCRNAVERGLPTRVRADPT